MKNILKTILPSPFVALMTLFLPIVASIYFVLTHFTDQLVTSEETAYIEAQNNFLGRLFLSEEVINGFNRAMDFVFWGVVALVVMVVIWAIASVKVSLKNHYAQEEFTNFKVNKFLWHEHFFVVFMLRTILVILIGYSTLSIIGRELPKLSVDVSIALSQSSSEATRQALITGIVIVAYQLVIISAYKIFRHLQAE